MPELREEDTLENLDLESAVSGLSNELFGQDSVEGAEADSPGDGEGSPGTPTTVDDPSPENADTIEGAGKEAKPEENSTEVQATGAPSTWTKENVAKWATIDPAIQQQILKREEDMFRGIEQYKSRAEIGDRYQSVVEPFKAQLEAEQVDPVQLFQAFASNHYLLLHGTPEQKVNVAAMLIRSYGLDLDSIGKAVGEAPAQPQIPPEVQNLDQRLRQIEQDRLNTQRTQFEQEVETFAKDPANMYFKDVTSDMAALLKTGAATSLKQAYEIAVFNNPVTRQKEIDRLTAERIAAEKLAEDERLKAAKNAQAADVTSKPKNRGGTTPVGSIDETLTETLASIKARE